MELACAARGIRVRAYDIFRPLVEFWQCLLADPVRLALLVRNYHPLPKWRFYHLQRAPGGRSKYERAAVFFAINRASFSGTTFSGGMSPEHPRFTESSIRRVESFRAKNLSVKCRDFTESIPMSGGDLLYLDPPYPVEHQGLYGEKGSLHGGFDHEALAGLLHGRDGWILSYSDTRYVRRLYRGYRIIRPRWKYGMSNDKRSREVLILSHDLEGARR